jgi:hypothetical protein
MAKLNKIMPPRNTTIRGQDHLLAYITPEEAQLLMDNGGAGKPGPMGIPAFYGMGGGGGTDDPADDDDGPSGGDGDGYSGYSGDDVEESYGTIDDGPSSSGYDTIGRAAEKDYGVPDPTSSQIEAGRGFDFGSPASRAIENAFALGFNQGPNRGMGYNISGREAAVALGQIADRMAMARAGYNLPGPLSTLGKIAGLIAQQNLSRIQDNIKAGYPVGFDKQGRVQGAWGPGLIAGTLAYSGNPIEGNPSTGWVDDFGGGDGADELRPRFAPVNPATGQCDEGYMFDEDLQACRLDTGYQSAAEGGGAFGDPGERYARMGLLDFAPTGLPQFQQQYGAGFGTPSEFDVANAAFRYGGAYEPSMFKNPYPTTGMQQVKLLS